MKYKRLFAEMYVREITRDDLAKLLNKSTKAISNRIIGKTSFTCSEVLTIMDTYFKNESLSYIFSDGSEKCYRNRSCS